MQMTRESLLADITIIFLIVNIGLKKKKHQKKHVVLKEL